MQDMCFNAYTSCVFHSVELPSHSRKFVQTVVHKSCCIQRDIDYANAYQLNTNEIITICMQLIHRAFLKYLRVSVEKRCRGVSGVDQCRVIASTNQVKISWESLLARVESFSSVLYTIPFPT
jgi:hypothetical protein